MPLLTRCPLCIYVAALIASQQKSVTSKVGEGFKVTTTDVKDVAHPNADGATQPVRHTLVAYSSLSNITGFRLDQPRGKAARCALALFSKKDDEGFHIHKLEYVEPDQVTNAIHCMRKLSKAEWATVKREDYKRIVRERKQHCPAFADVVVREDEAATRLPAHGVSEHVACCAQEVDGCENAPAWLAVAEPRSWAELNQDACITMFQR